MIKAGFGWPFLCTLRIEKSLEMVGRLKALQGNTE
jgi:hypothetical protein